MNGALSKRAPHWLECPFPMILLHFPKMRNGNSITGLIRQKQFQSLNTILHFRDSQSMVVFPRRIMTAFPRILRFGSHPSGPLFASPMVRTLPPSILYTRCK